LTTSGGEVPFESTAGLNTYQYLRQILPSDPASWVRNNRVEAAAPSPCFVMARPTSTGPMSAAGRIAAIGISAVQTAASLS